jgi:hypothetical protein
VEALQGTRKGKGSSSEKRGKIIDNLSNSPQNLGVALDLIQDIDVVYRCWDTFKGEGSKSGAAVLANSSRPARRLDLEFDCSVSALLAETFSFMARVEAVPYTCYKNS